MKARPTCFRLFVHWARRAASRADCTAGSSSAIKTAMMAMTTSSSISVKPRRQQRRGRGCVIEEPSLFWTGWEQTGDRTIAA